MGLSVLKVVLREPCVNVLRKSKLSFLKSIFHKHNFKILSEDAAKLKAMIPKSAIRVTEVKWSIQECSCGEMIEELRQEVTYGEQGGLG